MNLFGGVIPVTGISFFLFCVFAILVVGYAFGRITIKGVSLGDAGVFIIALLFGALFCSSFMTDTFGVKPIEFDHDWLSIIETFGLVLFVTSVGFIAGPKFFANMKKNFKSYVLIGVIIIVMGGLSALGCVMLGEHVFGYGAETITDIDGFVAMIVGLLSGSLTSTPAFSAAKATVAPEYESLVSVGHGIAYIFGVVGVVLFVQLVPKLSKANMDEERAKIAIKATKAENKKSVKLFHLDHMGIAVFSLAAILGTFIGKVKIPMSGDGLEGTCFSLTTTGGCLLVSLILGHFGRIGKLSLMPEETTLKLFRELGLVLFLVGAGIPGGADFVANFNGMYFVYGIIMTIVPLVAGFIFAKYVLKLPMLNNLGSITGGMTSTPALGTLISTAGTEDVAAAYAATYPIALIAVVLVSQFLIIMF
ncbi:MAG: permease [Acutalibacteraceae bacterium]|nr:permease [Acutalibacteraceae bacterium]